jgi:hypothetical protein
MRSGFLKLAPTGDGFADIILIISCEGQEHAILLDNCYRCDERWYLMQVDWFKKPESIDAVKNAVNVTATQKQKQGQSVRKLQTP